MRSPWDVIVDTLRQQPLAFAYLFGFRATGKTGPRGDWDVAVYLSTIPGEDVTWEKFRIEEALARALGTDAIQVVILNRLDAPLLAYEIISKGKVRCESDTEGRPLYEAAALRRFHDWRFWLDRHMAASQAQV